MKPVKGMNLDVSPDTQPPGTYRSARNWIYHDELDSLMQEPGQGTLRTILGDSNFILAYHVFAEDNIVFLTVGRTQESTTDSKLITWNGSGNTNQELADNSLAFDRNRNYSVDGFINSEDQRVLIWTDNVKAPCIYNLDIANVTAGQRFLVPNRKQVSMEIDTTTGGTLSQGSYFFSVAYTMEDGTELNFGPPHGPFRVPEDGGGIYLSLSNLDTDYSRCRIGVIQVSDNAISAFTGQDLRFQTSTATTLVSGRILDELLLEEFTQIPTGYTKAETLTMHDNRLYLGNLEEHDDNGDTLQRHANRIEPLWLLPRSAGLQETDRVNNDPNDARFMPDEVYAFYIAWIREDGSYTKAYHIPGRKFPSTIDVKVNSAATKDDSLTGANRTIDPADTITGILASQGTAGEDNYQFALQYLNNDRLVFDTDDDRYDELKYFHTRGTATAFGNQADFHFGRMGLWENENETYPTGFPAQDDYTFNAAGTVTAKTTDAIAGDKVRHHRFPSLSWCFENVTNFDFDADEFHGFQARFEFITIPDGYTGAVIYHAKRNGSDNLIVSHTPFHFGAANAYSILGEGGSGYTDYSVPSPINAPQHSFLVATSSTSPAHQLQNAEVDDLADAAGNPTQRTGAAFTNSNLYNGGDAATTSWSNWVNAEYQTRLKCHFNKGTAYPHDLLGVKPNLPRDCYVRLEYMLIQEEEFPDDIQGHPQGVGDSTPYGMRIFDEDGTYYYATTEDEDRHTSRRATFKMAQSQYLNRSFPQSEVKPMRNLRYIPAGAIDNEVKFDNRFGQECVYWDFDVSFANTGIYQATNHHNAGERWGYSIMNNPDGISPDDPSGNTDFAGYYKTIDGSTRYQYHRNGYWLDTQWSTAYFLAVQRLPFVNITAARFDCYLGYETQDLVACTPILTTANTASALQVGGEGEGTERRRVLQDVSHGDVYFSRRKYRVTSSAGFGTKRASAAEELSLLAATGTPAGTNIGGVGLAEATPADGTRSSTRGVISVINEVPTVSPVQSALHDVDNPQQSQNDFTWMKTPASPTETNKHPIIRDLLRVNDWVQPIIHVEGDTVDTNHQHRVARSAPQREGDGALGVRRLPALDFVEQPTNRGPIRHLASYGDRLLIHHDQSLFVTVGKEKIATSAGEVVVGSGDIFRVKPTEVVPSEFGYGGTQHPQSCTMTPNGYFFVDARNRKVFLYNGKLEEISQRGMRTYLQEALKLNDDFYDNRPTGVISNNVFAYHPGVHAEYDPKYHRILMMVRKQDVSTEPVSLPLNLANYHNSSDYDDKTFFLSYSLVNNAWVAFHDMYVDGFLSTQTDSYIWRSSANAGSKAALMHDVSSSSDVTYQMTAADETLAPYIDIAFPANESVQWQSFNWVTKARQHKTGQAEFGHIDLDLTFAKAAVYNDYQCSGDVAFTRASDVDVTTTQRVTLRHNGTEYQFNGFRDLVADRDQRFIDTDFKFVTGNIDAAKNWYDQRRFNSTHAVLRLTAPETTTNLLYLYDVDAKVRKAYR